MSQEIDYADLVSDLLDCNICIHCCMRYMNEKKGECYKDAESYIKNILSKGEESADYIPPSKLTKRNPCSACLGLLQLSDNDEFLNFIVEAVMEAGYDSDDVSFSLTLPIAVLLRDYSVWVYLCDKYNGQYGDKSMPQVLRKTSSTVSVKEAWKFTTAHRLAEKMNKVANNGNDGTFHVIIHIEYDMDMKETNCLIDMFPDIFKNRKNQKRKFHGEILTRKSVENALPSVAFLYFRKYCPVPPSVPGSYVKCGLIECVKESIFLAGRYNKYSRNLSQTPWLINGERRMDSSVEEIIGSPVCNITEHGGIKFSSSGREDVDVRTLGRGRPFILEVISPRKGNLTFDDMRKLENDINASTTEVSVRDLQIVSKGDLVHIKLGEQSKTKTYTCFCITKLKPNETVQDFKVKLGNLETITDITVNQKTPIRVLHRRSLAVRPRTVFWLKGEFQENKNDDIYFKLSLKVDAGTYIKEFVHGDFGRTTPNLSEILSREVDILALDVEEVALDWPPAVDYP